MTPLTLDYSLRYVVAVSFGPDSMALLSMLIEQGYQVHVAHVNYHRRPESKLEQSGLEQFCLLHDIPCSLLDVSQPIKSGNFQAAARQLRYEFFRDVMKENQCDVLLTAHHEDDHLETALFHEERQSNVPYYGIQFETTLLGMRVVRPLLSWTKADLLTYCHAHHVPYAIDASNASPTYTRNRIRLATKDWTNDARLNHLKLIEQKNISQQRFVQSIQANYPNYLPLSLFTQHDHQVFLTLYAYFQLHQRSFPITHAWIHHLQRIAISNKPNWMTAIEDGWFVKHYDRFEWVRLPDSKPYQVRYRGKPIERPWVTINPQAKDFPSWLKSGMLIRSAHSHDRWRHHGQHYRLNRLFGDWKMPLYLRKYWPVFVNQQGDMVYTPRYQREPNIKPESWLTIHTKRK